MSAKLATPSTERDPYQTSRTMYVIEAALEYFIAIVVGSTYLAKIGTEIGMDDITIGVLTAFVSLGQVFQLLAFFLIRRTPVKRWVTPAHMVSQLFFTLLYAVPFFGGNTNAKVALFVVLLLLAQVIHNVIFPAKTNWFMALIADRKRGAFTATKEIVSLLSGMIFSFLMSALIDRYEEKGEVRTAFLLIGITLLILTAAHTATLLLSREKPAAPPAAKDKSPISLLRDTRLLRVIAVSVLWAVANYATVPFYGTYQITELGFSMTFCSILTIAYSIVRALVSRPLGRFADKYRFANLLTVCFFIQAVAFLVNTFTVPENGAVMYTLYFMLHAIAMAGINSSLINLIYDYVDEAHRTGALALSQSISGVAGFLTTLLVTIPVEYIQKSGNTLFGISVYAQQVLSAFGLVISLSLILYIRLVVCRMKK